MRLIGRKEYEIKLFIRILSRELHLSGSRKRPGGLRITIANLYIRFCLFFLLTIVGLISAENWIWAGWLSATGLVLDIIRWRVCPEINMSADQLSKELTNTLKNRAIVGPHLRRQSLPINAALTIGFLYVVVLSLIDTYMPGVDLTKYLEFLAPLTELGYGVVQLVRAYTGVLTESGHEQRLLIVGHIYSFDFLFILLLTCIASFRYFYLQLFRGYIRTYNRTVIGLYKSPLSWSVNKHFGFFLLLVFGAYAGVQLQTDFNTMGWPEYFGIGQGYGTIGNITFPFQYLFSSGFFVGAMGAYYAALNLRASTACQQDPRYLDDPENSMRG